MVDSIANAIASYGKVAGLPQNGIGTDNVATSGTSFSDMLEKVGQGLMDTQAKAEAAAQSAATGNANLVQVMTAINNAEITLQTVTNIRDRLVTAIQDVLRTAV